MQHLDISEDSEVRSLIRDREDTRFTQRLVDVPNFGGFDGRMLGVRRKEVWEVCQALACVVSRNRREITTVGVRSAQELCAVN
jgi:hypothetical protein